ncbi:MAG: SEL1-like repeat protein [Labilithrix sp.]|nr:SEL1-like repeat protein [Labilithrix sp.]
MRIPFVSVGALTLATLGACTAEAPHTITTPADQRSCTAADAVNAGPSPFESALGAYEAEGPTSFVLARLDAACAGDPNACTLLGVIYESGDGTARDPAKAAAYRARSCGRSETDGPALDLGGCTELEPFRDRAIFLRVDASHCGFLIGCPAGCSASCDAALVLVRDRIQAPLLAACDRKRAAACHLAARAVESGIAVGFLGVLADPASDSRPARATALRERACAGGVGASCVRLAQDLGREKDTGAQRTKLVRACDLAMPSACLELGDQARVAHDLAAAETAYERACVLGLRSTCRDLAKMYAAGEIDGHGGPPSPWPRDDAKAARFRDLAADPKTDPRSAL